MNKKLGIHEYVIGLTLVPLLVMAASFGAFFLLDRFAGLDSDLLTRGRLIARQLAVSSEYGVFSNNQSFLYSVVTGVLQQPDVKAVVILDTHARTLAASGELTAGTTDVNNAADSVMAAPLPGTNPLLQRVNQQAPTLEMKNVVLLYQPILSTQVALEDGEIKPEAKQMGAVIVEMSRLQTQALKTRLLWVTILSTALFLLITLNLVRFASRRIIQPISQLSEAVQAIGSGRLETRVALPSCITELCTLTDGINQMTADLQHERAILQQRIDDATQQLRSLAFYDTLTQLPNRRLLLDRLTQTLNASRRNGRYGALMFIDLDNFKPLNDQYGHAVGDLLLIEVARRIRCCLREMDTVARYGGDEFVVILSELSADYAESVRQARVVAEKIRGILGETYHLGHQQEGPAASTHEHHCGSSVGVTLFQNYDADHQDVLRRADSAMYQAKQDGRNLIRFYEEIHGPGAAEGKVTTP